VHRYPLKTLISLVVVAACAFGCYQRIVLDYSLPFFVETADAHSVAIRRLTYFPLPTGLQSGDKLDLQAMSMRARYAVMPHQFYNATIGLPAGQVYQLSVYRDHMATFLIPVATEVAPVSPFFRQLFRWIAVVTFVLLSGMVLLVVWRGRGRAAAGFTLWILGALCGGALEIVHQDVFPGIAIMLVSNICTLLSGVGLYCLVESMVGAGLSLRVRWWWRGLFIAGLTAGTLTSQIIGPVLFITMGWAGLVIRPFQILWVISFLVPILMLFVSYRAVGAELRLKLKWMLWSGALWAFAILESYSRVGGVAIGTIMGGALYLLAMLGFLYAVLRHRAVDVSVIIDRTLVYGSVTALVVGILAATNSLVQHAALGTDASVLVQIVVPLALGIVLGQVRNYADMFVERVFFRRKYLAGKALRHFARHCGGYENAEELLQATAQIVSQKLAIPGLAVYLRYGDQYSAAQRSGEAAYPDTVKADDPAFAAARSGATGMDLSQMHSLLGTNGYVFQMGAQVVMVCANRPGEYYASDERKLLAYVARKVGAAVDSLRMQEAMRRLESKAMLVDALASSTWPPPLAIQVKARELAGVALSE
jgi:MFS family permease